MYQTWGGRESKRAREREREREGDVTEVLVVLFTNSNCNVHFNLFLFNYLVLLFFAPSMQKCVAVRYLNLIIERHVLASAVTPTCGERKQRRRRADTGPPPDPLGATRRHHL